MGGEVKDECGVAAVYLKSIKDDEYNSQKAAIILYKLLLNLQNRGQLGAGITTFNKYRKQLIDTYRNIGSVNEVFKANNKSKRDAYFRRLAGNKGIGHVRYATCGSEDRSYAQPFERHHGRRWKWFSFCFNGNLTNYVELKNSLLEKTDYHITRDTDTEIMMHYIARALKGGKKPDHVKVFNSLAKKFDGAYNIAFIDAHGTLVVVRGPLGIRPLAYGENKKMLAIASESNALVNIGVTDFQSLEPGYLLVVKDGKTEVKKYSESPRKAHCMFEWVYFANVSSTLNSKSVYITRTNLGEKLAEKETEKVNPDDYVVVPVPDTSKPMADAMAYKLGIPSREGLLRNRYVGRTFIEGSTREEKVQSKYTILRDVVKDKKVILVDDSVVRGATSKKLVSFIKKHGGAKEVHLRIACPPIICPCFYGIDMSTISELLVPKFLKHVKKDNINPGVLKEIAKSMNADSLIYTEEEDLVSSIDLPKEDLCMACINGEYPTKGGKKLFKKALFNHKNGIQESRTYEC